MLNITEVFNTTSTQIIAGLSFNGEPITVLKLGYATIYEFVGFQLVVTPSSIVTYIDVNGRVSQIDKTSFFFEMAMSRVSSSDLLFQNKLGLVSSEHFATTG
ncbi:hypothetical protein ACRFZU_000504 [Escherichia coli]|uniref:hypothetical protein n=1 Tax=Enterobacter hormaechei TaxID=158836 RepID=UPI0006688A78|nr:hypothetical protein [Enterobacter hormaechei]HCI6795741.1 hypothetical protein [Klebsiella quasipneumoniae subsp. quasipneumoniae]